MHIHYQAHHHPHPEGQQLPRPKYLVPWTCLEMVILATLGKMILGPLWVPNCYNRALSLPSVDKRLICDDCVVLGASLRKREARVHRSISKEMLLDQGIKADVYRGGGCPRV